MFKYKFIICSVFRPYFANIEVVFRLCTKSHKLFYKKCHITYFMLEPYHLFIRLLKENKVICGEQFSRLQLTAYHNITEDYVLTICRLPSPFLEHHT